MNKISDHTLATWLLESKECGYTFGLFCRRNAKRYVLLFGMFGLVAIIFAAMEWTGQPHFSIPYPLTLWVIGFACGVFVRDVSWFASLQRQWPFREKVTNWGAVHQIADDQSLI